MLESAAFVIVPLEEHPYSYGQMSLLGSLALGKYVIASKVSGISDYTEKCQSVISVKQHDVNEMYRAIKKYINENVKSKDRNIPRNEVENNFSEEQMENKIKDFVFKVIQYGNK
jgi:glycosyltransferase involved in cell wall biosynthesis